MRCTALTIQAMHGACLGLIEEAPASPGVNEHVIQVDPWQVGWNPYIERLFDGVENRLRRCRTRPCCSVGAAICFTQHTKAGGMVAALWYVGALCVITSMYAHRDLQRCLHMPEAKREQHVVTRINNLAAASVDKKTNLLVTITQSSCTTPQTSRVLD